MMYCSWEIKFNRQNVFVIVGNFQPFYPPLTPQKINISKKWRRHLEVSSFKTSVQKILILCYIAPEVRHVTDVIVIFYFGLFLPLYPPNSPKNENFKKMKRKKHLEISFYTSVPKVMIICYTIPEIWYMTDFGLFFALLPPNSPKKSNFQKSEKKCLDTSPFYSCAAKIVIR